MGLLPAGIGTPDARKRACPVRGALDGILLSKGSKALSFDPGDFIIALFCQVDTHLQGVPKHPHATLWPTEVVTLGGSVARTTTNLIQETVSIDVEPLETSHDQAPAFQMAS